MRALRVAALLVPPLLLLIVGIAAAADPEISLTQNGPDPAVLTVTAGDHVVFVNTDTFVHRVVSSSSNWGFDSGPIVPGDRYRVEQALSTQGSYTYRGAGLDDFQGTVVVASSTGGAAVAPSPGSSAGSPTPRASGSPGGSAASPGAAAGGSPGASAGPSSSGSPGASARASGAPLAVLPPGLLGGSFAGVSPAPLPDQPAPQVAPFAPLASVAPTVSIPPDPYAGGSLAAGEGGGLASSSPDPVQVAAAGQGLSLASPVPARRYGLPVALALVLSGGVLSMLVRVLLAVAPASRFLSDPGGRVPVESAEGPASAGPLVA